MTVWKTPEAYVGASLAFVYRKFSSDNQSSFDLDDELLDELIALFVSLQLHYWKDINRIADFRFPERKVPSYIDQVKTFVETDGFIRLFGEYITYFICLRHIHKPNKREITQKKPHSRANQPGLDHIVVWPSGKSKYRIVFTEVKTTEENARERIRDAFDEFKGIEDNESNQLIAEQVLNDMDWYFIETVEQVRELVDSLFWQKRSIYHICVVSKQQVPPTKFNGYENYAAKAPDSHRRRWATVIPVENWTNWENIRSKVKSYIEVIKERGEF